MRMRTFGAMAALLLVVSGCGGGDDEQAKKAIADSIMKSSGNTFDVKQSEADCIAAGFVDDIGVDQLQDYGILSKDAETAKSLSQVKMSQDDSDAAASAFVDCVDVQQLLNDQLPLDTMDDAVASCVKEVVDEDAIHEILAATFRGEDPQNAVPDLTQKLQECVTA
jgi:hypothetical protein